MATSGSSPGIPWNNSVICPCVIRGISWESTQRDSYRCKIGSYLEESQTASRSGTYTEVGGAYWGVPVHNF